MTPRPLPSPLMVVADAAHAPAGLASLVAIAWGAGATFFELRRTRGVPPDGSQARLAEVRACLGAAPGATVLVNDRVDLAVLAGAAGAHVGQDDMPADSARRLLGPGRWLGLSTHDEAQVESASGLPVDYIALGPIFASATKSGHAAPLGLARLSSCRRLTALPVVAIGGITAENAAEVRAAGADAVAVVSAVAVGDVRANVRRLMEAVL